MTPPIPSQSLPGLPDMVERCRVALQGEPTPEEAVERLVPILRDLIAAGGEPDDFDCSDAGYTRHLIHEQQDPPFSLYTMVWRPGQWTPVHDHGAWGIVGVLEGELHERRDRGRLEPRRPREVRAERVRRRDGPGALAQPRALAGTVNRSADTAAV